MDTNIAPALVATALSKSYGSRHPAVAEVNLDLPPGVACALLGPNGCGKSTLLRLLAGIEPPDTGSLTVAGLDLRDHPHAAKAHVGIVPDGLGLLPQLTVAEHLEFVAAMYGVPAPEAARRTEDLLAALGLSAVRYLVIAAASLGIKKKCALAMALLHRPRLLLLDEPVAGLDAVSVRAAAALIRSSLRGGASALIAGHNFNFLESVSSRHLVMNRGRIVAEGRAAAPLEPIFFRHFPEPVVPACAWLEVS